MNIEYNYNHLTIPEATQIQLELKKKINLLPMTKKVETVGGADISFNKLEKTVYGGIVLFRFPSLIPFAYSLVKVDVNFPYVPGYLAFREVPALMKAWEQLPEKPDLLLVDGHGLAHPRRLGIASHFGALTGQTSLGCAKKILCGKYEEPNLHRGSSTPIIHQSEQVGWALRTKNKVKPIFVSPGYGLSMDDSLHIVVECLGKYRIPEPTRLAHEYVNRCRVGELTEGIANF